MQLKAATRGGLVRPELRAGQREKKPVGAQMTIKIARRKQKGKTGGADREKVSWSEKFRVMHKTV